MDDLMMLYGEDTAKKHVMDFNEANERINFLLISNDTQINDVTCMQSQTSSCDELLSAISSSPPTSQHRPLVCLISIPLIHTSQPYRLDIRKKSYQCLLEKFGIAKYSAFGRSAANTFDLVPNYQNNKATGFFASIFVEHFFGLSLIYDATKELCLGICWAGAEMVMPRFLKSLTSLRQLSRQPCFVLFATVVAFNLYQSEQLAINDCFISRVEKRTGYQGWDMVAFEAEAGAISELSAKVSGILTSLAADKRLMRIMDDVLCAIETESMLNLCSTSSNPSNPQNDLKKRLAIIKRRLGVQHMYIDLLLDRAKNQLTAVR